MTEKALYKLAMEISGEDPSQRGKIYGPMPYWYGGREVEGWFVIGKYTVLGVPEHIRWMSACPDETTNKRMFAAVRPFIPHEGVSAAGYDIKPDMLRKGIRAVTGGKYSHGVVYQHNEYVPALNARLLLRNLEALKSRTVWIYADDVKYGPCWIYADDVKYGPWQAGFRPAYMFEMGDADCPGAVWVAQLPVNLAYDGGAGFTDCETKERLALADIGG